ncbi:MAG: hypothetical protein M1822_010004 [Bathelium mastoideum]|nr:MAG: hypothetical protein M1822_010004 [Bathelium mastoideum]
MGRIRNRSVLAATIGVLSRVDAKSLWSSAPAAAADVIQQSYAVGNGRLGALPFGDPGSESVNLNVDTLWSGGPFECSNYTGGNPSTEKYTYLPGIRQWIFQNGTGNVSQLLGSEYDCYGSYQVLGNFSVSIANITTTSNYNRSLDLTTGIHTTSFTTAGGAAFTSRVYCSYPDQVCVYEVESNTTLPMISISLGNTLADPSLQNETCGTNNVALEGYTSAIDAIGMKYYASARVAETKGTNITTLCSNAASATLTVPSVAGRKSLSIYVGADTNYDIQHGNTASNFSFQGSDPTSAVNAVVSTAASKSEAGIRQAHIKDYQSLASTFTLNLPDTAKSEGLETSDIIAQYNINGTGDPYLESLLFDYARHLSLTSSRDNSLPSNLQGRWSTDLYGAWSVDYHGDINLQMNYWLVDQTGLGEDVSAALWNYMQETWVPRGMGTAQLLYGAPGWVAHDEMNIFGHTAMKYDASWADYPASALWMMQQVYDHYSYSQNASWFINQGYPLMKGIAQFWLSQLQQDTYFNDSTLVVNPCNSPEHGPTTFACTHYQQLLSQLFTSILSTSSIIPNANVAGSDDAAFFANVSGALAHLDTGIHIGSWGELKEWKLPDSLGYDVENDTHRHLSQLVGWFPGYSVSGIAAGYTNATIQHAVATSLWSRGPGIADANAGWEKVWRAACWARLNETDEADYELRLAVGSNFAPNGFSMYSGHDTPFQIDANFGLAAAMLSMLVVDLPDFSNAAGGNSTQGRTVVLGPAIPARWGGGSVEGLRVRGGGIIDFGWDDTGLVNSVTVVKEAVGGLRLVDRNGNAIDT